MHSLTRLATCAALHCELCLSRRLPCERRARQAAAAPPHHLAAALSLAADALSAPRGGALGGALLAALVRADAAAALCAALAVALADCRGALGSRGDAGGPGPDPGLGLPPRLQLEGLGRAGNKRGPAEEPPAGRGAAGAEPRALAEERQARSALLQALLVALGAAELPLPVALDAIVQVSQRDLRRLSSQKSRNAFEKVCGRRHSCRAPVAACPLVTVEQILADGKGHSGGWPIKRSLITLMNASLCGRFSAQLSGHVYRSPTCGRRRRRSQTR